MTSVVHYYWEKDNTMNKSELKQLIKQELEEHLYAHPSKHKGGWKHPGSQPHVKDAKKNAKTINVRHKTTKEKLDISDEGICAEPLFLYLFTLLHFDVVSST